MRNLLTQLVKFTDVNLLSPTIVNYSSEDLKDLKEEIHRFQQKMEKKITTILIRTEYQEQLIPQLRFIRQKLVLLSDQIFSHLPEISQIPYMVERGSEISALSELKFEKLQTIENILTFIHLYGTPYNDDSIKVSNYHLTCKKQDLRILSENIIEIFQQKNLPVELSQIMRDFVDGFSLQPYREISSHELDYAFRLLTSLEKVIKDSPDPKIKIAQLFIDLDFNYAGMLEYARNFIQQLVRSAQMQSEIRLEINELIRQVQLIEPNLIWHCDSEHNNLKDHILTVLKFELDSLIEDQDQPDMLDISGQDLLLVEATQKQMDLWADIAVKLKLLPFQSTTQVRGFLKRFVRSVHHKKTENQHPSQRKDAEDDQTVIELHGSLYKQIYYLEKKYSRLFTGLMFYGILVA